MDWQVLLVVVVSVVVAGAVATLGALLSRERGKRRRAEAEKAQREGEVKRLVDEREVGRKTDKEAADELSKIMARWNPTDPGSGTDGRARSE